MLQTIRRILELQPHYLSYNTPEMQERGRLIRNQLVGEIRELSVPLSRALGRFGRDFDVGASDGMGRKTELPWVRFHSQRLSPNPTQGYYCVLHFSTDGSAVHITLGCRSSQFLNGSFQQLPNMELDRCTAWARNVINEAMGTLDPFVDPPDFGATRPLPISFQRATAVSKRITYDELEDIEIKPLLIRAANMLRTLYQAQTEGRDLQPAELDELEIERMLRPPARGQGQGIGLSTDERRAVELHAMNLAEKLARTTKI